MVTFITGTESLDWDSLIEVYTATSSVVSLLFQGDWCRVKQAFERSYKVVTALDNHKIVAAGRMISDGECYAWIHDIAVHPNVQGKGIGKQLMQALIKGNEHLLIGLTSSFDTVEFYKRIGFKRHKTAMAKYPGPSTYLE